MTPLIRLVWWAFSVDLIRVLFGDVTQGLVPVVATDSRSRRAGRALQVSEGSRGGAVWDGARAPAVVGGEGYYVDVEGKYVDVKGYYVDGKGYYVDGKDDPHNETQGMAP
eukprot:1178078-Prorocentrum_minimum.AAC.2